MNAKHTKAPWRELVTRIDDVRGYQICHLDLHEKSEAERDANRRLIAAAPELLAIVQKYLDSADKPMDMSDIADIDAEARVIIAKAKGEV